MKYINCIAEYCHTSVADNGGFPNKNIGDAFLMTWPLTDGAWSSQTPGMQTPVQDKAESGIRYVFCPFCAITHTVLHDSLEPDQ